MDKEELFGKFKSVFGEFKMPENTQDALKDVAEIASGEDDIKGKLGKLKDKFFVSGDSDDSKS